MSTVIYLANQNVQIVTGTQSGNGISVKKSYSLETPEGSTINGIIMNVEAFTEFIKEEWKKKDLPTKDVILVVNSTKFAGKTIEIPKLGKKKTKQFISREYADIGRNEGSIYGYTYLGPGEGKLRRIYSEAIEPDFIKDYVEIFSKAGIKLSAIYSNENTLIRFVEKTAALRSKTFLFILAEATSFTLLLWVNGSFYHYNMNRCFHDPGTVEYAEDLGRTISQMIQFMQAHQLEYHLEKIVVSGVEDEELDYYKTVIEDMGIKVRVEGFSYNANSSSSINNMLHAVTGLYKQDKTADYLPLYLDAAKHGTSEVDSSSKIKIIAVIGGSLLVMLLVFAAVFIVRYTKQKELDVLEDYNNNPARLMELAEYDEIVYRNAFLNSQFDSINSFSDNIYTYPLGGSKVRAVFEKCAEGLANLTFSNFSATEGMMSVSARTDNVEDINTFVKRLTEQDTFNKVEYTGYSYMEDSGQWNIRVTCTLAESAGRED